MRYAPQQLDQALSVALEVALEAGELVRTARNEAGYEVRHKSGTELVTSADLSSDRLIRTRLEAEFPDHRYLSEELEPGAGFDFSGPVWVIDPIDGTANYTHGHPHVAVSIALVWDGEPCVGVVHAPFLDELYWATLGGGAKQNGVPLAVSRVRELSAALVGTGFPHDRSDLSRELDRTRKLVTYCQDMRRTGSAALDIAWVAAGRLDGHCESLAPWDLAAAALIATEAGARRGNLATRSQEPLPPLLRGYEFIVATPLIFDPLCALLTP